MNDHMDPEHMIGRTGDLVGDVQRFASTLRLEAEGVADEWGRLCQAGGRRPDNAMALLVRLRPILDDLAGFCKAASEHLTAMNADPFQRRESLN